MAHTFLGLTNKLLRRINEVEIEQSDFASARGVQALAKDAINASIRYINTQQFEWPFNAATRTETLVVDQTEYDFPAALKVPKWDSFILLPDSALSIYGYPLEKIERDQYLRYLKIDADNTEAGEGAAPRWVAPSQGFGFEVHPVPDETYDVYYEYFITVTDLDAYDDEPTIPELYTEAIIQGGIYHMYMFRDNTEQADRARTEVDKHVANMRKILINTYDRIRSTMIPRSQSSAPIYDNFHFRSA